MKVEVNSGAYQVFVRHVSCRIFSGVRSVLIDDAGFKPETTDLRSGLIAVPAGDFIVDSKSPRLPQFRPKFRCAYS